ncbi:MAG: DUF2400 family protein [Crocinitomicaceae bacterium]|nr:MAG: DUF2400 family protein [Crocinitomicaceae bacterium]
MTGKHGRSQIGDARWINCFIIVTYDELKDFLDFKAEQYEHPRFLESDPIQLPHRFSKKEDIELVGFLVSTIAWGNRVSIIKSGERLLEIMEQQPHAFIQNYNSKLLQDSSFVHRTFNSIDLDFYFRSLQHIYKDGCLETAFQKHTTIEGVKGRIVSFRTKFMEVDHLDRSHKHLSNPEKNSAAKRLNMFNRVISVVN